MYLPIHQAAEYLGVPIIKLQKLKYRDIKNNRNGRFVYKDNKWCVYVSDMGIDFPENERLRNDFWKFRAYFKSEFEMAKVCTNNKNFRNEYQNLRNFRFKNPKHSRRVYEILEQYAHSHPLPSVDVE
ncbi:MAG: hypothetical protein LBT96_01610 [Campylobacteraceae bacterium]|jgi:hypothetical protein|nr:hypothetical protein [Campylobacteraceae bacterium]